MKIILLHSDKFEYVPKKKAIKSAEQISKETVSVDEALVAMISVEKNDEKDSETITKKAIKDILEVKKELKVENLVLYPWVHLSSSPSRPDFALSILRNMEKNLKDMNEFKILKRAPFGWYKGFEIKVKGHPLSELSREINTDIIDDTKPMESKSIEEEAQVKHEYFVYHNGERLDPKKFNFDNNKNLKIFFSYETDGNRSNDKAPAHVELMQNLELVDYEPASDSGNLRWYPSGWLIKRLIEDHVTNVHIENGAYCVETPIMYDFLHPSLEAYMNRFPARQYTIRSGQNNYFLRFAACFGQFLIGSDATISYKNLPLKLFEMTHYSFRREQSGELAALRRLRTFSMPDQHTIVADIEMAKDEFRKQFILCLKMMNDFELEYEGVFRFQKEFYNENKSWIDKMISEVDKPVMLELFDKRYAYFVCKFEFNVVDQQKKAAALSTVQIDVENAERFDIKYVSKDGKEKFPLILHTSLSGAVERVLYAILEKSAKIMREGKKPKFPFWLTPIHVRLLPVADKHLEYCVDLSKKLETHGLRVDIDDRNERVGKMIRNAERNWIPFIFVIGDDEIKNGVLKGRLRGEEDQDFEVEELIKFLKDKTREYPIRKLPMSKYLSKRPIFYSRGK